MIRIKNIHYKKIRREYLHKLAESGAAQFDKRDILNDSSLPKEGKTNQSFMDLSKGSGYLRTIRDYLFSSDGLIIRDRLRGLLAGPDETPRSFGGSGTENLLSYFQKIRDNLGPCEDKADRDTLQKIFCYRTLSQSNNKELPYWLIRSLHQETCPYCNIGYVSVIVGKDTSYRTELDHYFPKSKYPFFSICLFNLVPACGTCNRIKKNSIRDIIYPYEESFDEAENHYSFRIVADKGHPEVWTGNSDDFSIGFTLNNKEDLFGSDYKLWSDSEDERRKRIKNSIQLLCLDGRYTECHKEEIRQLIKNYYEYNKIGLEMIMNAYYEKEKNLEYIRDLLYFAFLDEEEWGKSPLNKMKSDLLYQLDMISKEY